MSAFINSVKSLLRGYVPSKNIPIRVTRECIIDSSTDKLYIISAEWVERVVVNPRAGSLEKLMDIAIDKLRYHVYGDLYELLMDLKKAAIEGDYNNVVDTINKIEKEIKG